MTQRRLSKIIEDFFRFFLARNLPNLRQEPSSLVSTSLTHSGDDEDPGDSGIISLFCLLESPESSSIIHVRNACVFHWTAVWPARAPRARPPMRAVPYSDLCVSSRRSRGYKNASGRLRGLSALHNTASDGPLIEKDQATAEPKARRMECDCEGASVRNDGTGLRGFPYARPCAKTTKRPTSQRSDPSSTGTYRTLTVRPPPHGGVTAPLGLARSFAQSRAQRPTLEPIPPFFKVRDFACFCGSKYAPSN